jgi:hypothetical protein
MPAPESLPMAIPASRKNEDNQNFIALLEPYFWLDSYTQ